MFSSITGDLCKAFSKSVVPYRMKSVDHLSCLWHMAIGIALSV